MIDPNENKRWWINSHLKDAQLAEINARYAKTITLHDHFQQQARNHRAAAQQVSAQLTHPENSDG